MSFRYTNQLTARLRQRLLWARAEEQLMLAAYTARHPSGLRCVVDAYGRVSSLVIDPAREAEFKTTQGDVDSEKLSAAVREVIFAANERRRAAKVEAYRRSVAAVPELPRDDATLWFVENAGTLRPLPHEAVRDIPAVAYGRLKQRAAAERKGIAPGFTHCGLPVDAGLTASADVTPGGEVAVDSSSVAAWGRLRDDVPEVAKTYRPMRAALLQLGDSRSVRAQQRLERSDNELFFWRRVDLIKRAQGNVIAGPKRPYAHHQQGVESTEFLDKVDLNFVS